MPIFIRTQDGRNYRVKGERIKQRWLLFRWFGLFVHFEEEPDGNDLWLFSRQIVHFAYISQANLDAMMKAQAEREAAERKRNPRPGSEPKLVVPR